MSKILLIETSATLRRAMQKLLQLHGYEVDLLGSIDDALTHLNNFDSANNNYRGIVIGWPSHSSKGIDDLLAMLSDTPFRGLPLLVMGHEADSEKLSYVSGREQTAFHLWDNIEEVALILPKLLSEKWSQETCCCPEEETQIRVLLVDDSPTARVKFRKLLDECGYHTTTANSASEALEVAQQDKFDIAIIDYFMPDENGDSLCGRLRRHPRTANIMLAMLTSTYLDKVIQSSLAAGAVECMFKNEADELFKARVAAMSRNIRITNRIEKERTQLQGILASVGDGVYGLNQECEITFINAAAKKTLGFSPEDNLVGRKPGDLFHFYKDKYDDNAIVDLKYIEHAIKRGRELHNIESIFTRVDGTPIQVELTIYPLKLSESEQGAVFAFRDISVRKLLEDELKWQANHDPLTKLLNRKYIEEAIDNEIKRLRRCDKTSALLYVDLDRFKYLNDTVGHSAGDQLLVELGHHLSSRLRETDLLGRLGDDEFGILLRNVDINDVHSIAEKYRQLIASYDFNREGRIYKIHASLGVAMIDANSTSTGEIFANADIACQVAKGQGRNSTHVYTKDQDNRTAMDMELGWSVRLNQALENNTFQLYYQPIMSLHDIDLDNLPREGSLQDHLLQTQQDNCNIYEVLLRLHDSHGNPIPPNSFLPTAERFNLMRDIDTWVIKAAMKMMHELGPEYKHKHFTINLSGQSLDPSLLVPIFMEGINKYKLDPSRFLFEITETCAVNDTYAACGLIEELSKLGCRFALDDFGSGYCSFSHLKRLPVDYIKIDGLFVQDILNDPMDMAIIRSITNIAHTLGKETIAEFVESPEVLRLLKECGVDYVQGYYIAKPSPQLAKTSLAIKDNLA
jgi:diguanylate cyclase (GGDEF)-like protein/PAS domain S-box-containing protein